MSKLKTYLRDPLSAELMAALKAAPPMKSALLDITHKCNLRCVGCYYFTEGMDAHRKERDDGKFLAWVEAEAARGTNMLNVVGGEPALEVDRLRVLAEHFHLIVVTNGTMPLPMKGLEDVRVAVSFWGDEKQDLQLRGRGKSRIFDQALEHFRDDPRAGFYYTTVPGFSEGIRPASERIIENGNFIAYNFYGDLTSLGGRYDHRGGFADVAAAIDAVRDDHPEWVLSSPYTNRVISTRELLGETWGYDQCPSLTYDHPENQDRITHGKKYPTKFRAYNADLTTTRRCCVGSARDCDTCTDLWATSGWVQAGFRRHLRSEQDFIHWLGSTVIFYMQTGMLDYRIHRHLLPQLYARFDVSGMTTPQRKTSHMRLPVVTDADAQPQSA